MVEELPDSVQAILAARVDRPGGRRQGGAAGGVRDRPDLLERADAGARRRRAGRLGCARGPRFHPPAAGFLTHGETEYAFKHALTREVVYGSVPKARRARLHADFAGWLERTGGGRDEDAALLAHHYAQAARPEDADLAWADDPGELEQLRIRAVRWLRRAAELAIRRYDLDEGMTDLQRALELCEPAERSQLWSEIGRASALKFDGERFWEAMKRALKLTDDPQEQADILGQLAVQTAIRSGMWPRRPEHEEVTGWIDRALQLAKPGSAAHIQALIARAYWNPSEEHAAAEEGEALAEQSGDLVLRSYAWGARASTAFAERDYEQSFGWAQRRLALMPQLRTPTTTRRSTRS